MVRARRGHGSPEPILRRSLHDSVGGAIGRTLRFVGNVAEVEDMVAVSCRASCCLRQTSLSSVCQVPVQSPVLGSGCGLGAR